MLDSAILCARRGAAALLMVVAVVGAGERCLAQPEPVRHVMVRSELDSGRLENRTDREQVVFSKVVQVAGAPWLRLVFDSTSVGPKAFVRVTSFEDGEYQTLDAEALLQWQNTTAYFNGSAVLVEVVAPAHSNGHYLTMSRVLAGSEPATGIADRRVCDATDSRVGSADARVGRLIAVQLPLPSCPAGLPCGTVAAGMCTGEIIDRNTDENGDDRICLSAGHCFDPANVPDPTEPVEPVVVMQFGAVPDTDAVTCSLRHPPVAKQFVVNSGRLLHNNPGDCGNDWAAYLCCPNSTTGKTVWQEQGAAFTLAAAVPANGAFVRKIGYGADGPDTTRFCACVPGRSESTKNGTQQRADGVVTAPIGVDYVIRHNAHTCGGDSGCALINAADELVGVHTAGQCQPNPTAPANCGTALTNPNLLAAIAALETAVRPANDDCVNAQTVTNGTIPYLTKDATTDGPTDSRFNFDADRQVQNDIWYKYTFLGAAARNVKFSVCNSSFDTRLAIYDQACPAGPDTALAVADDSPGCGNRSELTFMMNPGQTVLIRIGAYGNHTGMGTLEIGPARAPGNNACTVDLQTASVGSNSFDNSNATTDGPAEAACGGGQITQDVWWSFFACQTGMVRIETCGATPFDTCLAVYAFDGTMAPCPRGALIAANDNACSLQSAVDIMVESGTTYLIRVGGREGAHGSGVLFINPIRPSNDNCNDAITVFEGRHLFDNRGATTDGPTPLPACGVTCTNDVWYYYIYTGAAVANITFETCDPLTDFDTVLAVYAGAGCPPAAAQTDCNDDFCGLSSRVVVTANPGDDYVIRIGSTTASRTGCGALRIIAGADAAPTNNRACDYSWLYTGTTAFTTVDATTDGPNPVACLSIGNADLEADVWYQFLPTRPGNLVVDACDATFDARIAGYPVRFAPGGGPLICPPTTPALACGDDDCGVMNTRPAMNLPIATDADGDPTEAYWVRVGGFDAGAGAGAETGTGHLSTKVILNDNCAAARWNDVAVLVGDGDNVFNNQWARPFKTNPADPADGIALGAACDAMNQIRSDLWFQYRSTATGDTTFSVTSMFDNVVAVYNATRTRVAAIGAFRTDCPGGAPAQCDHGNMDLGGGLKQSSVTLATTAGNYYWVRVGGFGDGEAGDGLLTIMPSPMGPPNNDCFNARAAELGDNPFTTIGATTDGPALPAGCAPDNQINQDVWFSYTVPMNGNLVIETCRDAAAFDTRIAAYTGVCTALALVANSCNDDAADPACAPRSRVNIQVTAGQGLFIRVGGVNNMTGNGVLTLRFIMNDRCQTAKEILGGGGPFPYLAATAFFDSTGANTDGAGDAACLGLGDNQVNQDLYYYFNVPQKGRLTVDTIGSTFDTKLAIYDGGGGVGGRPLCPPAAAALACNDDIIGGVLQSRVARDVMGGDLILIRVGGFRTAQGLGQVNITFTDNDTCDRARRVREGVWPFDTRGAAQDGMASCGSSNTTPDVWFYYTASCDGDVIADTCDSNYDTVVSIYNDDCAALMEKACNDDDFAVHCAGLRASYVTTAVTTGQSYLIRVSGFNGAVGTGNLRLQCETKGACCIGATCQVLRRSECTGAFRMFTMPDEACNAADDAVTPCCKADFNHNGIVSVQDLFDFLTAYFGNDLAADADGSGAINVQDIFTFLAAYFAGCA